MKKMFALVLATAMIAGFSAPSFAAQKCAFNDASLCKVESIYNSDT